MDEQRMLKRALLGLGLGVLAGVLLVSCSGSDAKGTDNQTDPEVSVDELPARYAAAYCEAAGSCFGAGWSFFGPEGKGEDCVTLYTRTFEDSELRLLADLVASGKVSYDAQKASACVEAVRGGGCQYLGAQRPEVCEQAAAGHTARGAACGADFECVGADYCHRDQSCPGVCTERGTAGAPCSRDAACTDGLSCDRGACTAVVAVGASCDTNQNCDVGANCGDANPDDTNPGRTCERWKDLFVGEAGATCHQREYCKPPSVCVLTGRDPVTQALTGTCQAQVASGAACQAALPDQCTAGDFCNGIDIQATPPRLMGTCEAAPAVGQPCGSVLPVTEPPCSPYARCVGADPGVCVALARVGEACTENVGCYSGNCAQNRCAISADCN